MVKTVLKTEGLTKHYGGIQALVDADLEVKEGEHVGVNDLFGSLSAPGDNIFAIKTTIWLSR